VQGQVELVGLSLASAAGRWLPAGWRVAGELSTRARMAGTFGAPAFTGELTGRNMAVRNTAQGVDWQGADLALSMRGTEARIERFEVQAGGGTAIVTGTATFGSDPRADLKLTARRFAALQRVDRRVVASGELDATLSTTRLVLRGQLKADEGLIDIARGDAPSLGDDVAVRRAEADNAAEDADTSGTPRTARTQVIDLRLDLGEQFRLRGRGVDTRLAGQARLTSAAGRLQLNGTIEAQDGTYAAYGQKLSIDRGLLVFTGPLENPRLDIEATRSNLDIRVGVAITGTAINPRVRLFSEPEMADTDKLSWLILGRAPDGLARTDLALLQRAAYALVSGESESVDLVKAVGLDELSVRQSDGEVRETVVTLGKQLSRRWYVGYERSLNATTGTWQLIYRAAQRFTLRAQSGVENSLDLIWTWLWD
jgi:translocation and assembly module TamB